MEPMRNSLFRIVLLALAVFAVAFVSAPFYSYRALRAATVAEDIAGARIRVSPDGHATLHL